MKQAGNSNKGSGLALELQLGPFRVSGENPTPVMAAIHKWIEAEGKNLNLYSAGLVQVLLDETILDQPGLYPDANSTLVLSLESLDLVHLSNDHIGNIRWFCQRDPRELVGPLLDHYRGTYYRKHQLVFSSDQDLEIYDLPKAMEQDSTLLAAVCAAREAGINAETIRAQLRQAAVGLTLLEAGTSSTCNANSNF